ncbi:MAG TPA: hypothetical protein VE684_21245, partial [Crenalkalicoccus sp.]|nr:hypothetical protein [Crenalkalicoccus sp.]
MRRADPLRNLGARPLRVSDLAAVPPSLLGKTPVILPLRRGAFRVEAMRVGLGDVVLLLGQSSPMLVQTAVPAGLACVLLPLSGAPLRLNGSEAGPGHVLASGPGALQEAAAHGEVRWALIVLAAATVERAFRLPRRGGVLRPDRAALLRCDLATLAEAASLLADAEETLTADPGVFAEEEARRALRASLIEMLQGLLDGAWGGAL